MDATATDTKVGKFISRSETQDIFESVDTKKKNEYRIACLRTRNNRSVGSFKLAQNFTFFFVWDFREFCSERATRTMTGMRTEKTTHQNWRGLRRVAGFSADYPRIERVVWQEELRPWNFISITKHFAWPNYWHISHVTADIAQRIDDARCIWLLRPNSAPDHWWTLTLTPLELALGKKNEHTAPRRKQ